MGLPSQLARSYILKEQIGKGRFSTVYKCRNRTSGKDLAVKKIRKIPEVDTSVEVNILRKVRHDNIVRYMDHEDTLEYMFIITEYVKGNTLHQVIGKNAFSIRDNAFIIANLMKALSYLHDLGIVHRDISTNNVFLELSDGAITTVKLGDFGIAAELKDGIQLGLCGTSLFISPEMKLSQIPDFCIYNFKVDIYSAGIILLILFIPVSELGVRMQIRDITSYKIPHPAVNDLAQKMIHVNPRERFSAEDVLNHHWIRQHSTN